MNYPPSPHTHTHTHTHTLRPRQLSAEHAAVLHVQTQAWRGSCAAAREAVRMWLTPSLASLGWQALYANRTY